MAEDISVLLASRALERSQAIFSMLRKNRLKLGSDGWRIANNIAVMLHLINTYLISLPPYWIESDIDQHCRMLFRDLQAVTLPTKRPTSSSVLNMFNRNASTDPEMCLVTFFQVQKENAKTLQTACEELYSMLTKDENSLEGLPDAAYQHLDTPNTSDDVNNGIFKALQSIAECDQASHQYNSTATTSKVHSGTLRHPARLCLHELENGQDRVFRSIGILVSTMNMDLWQEFCIRMYVYSI